MILLGESDGAPPSALLSIISQEGVGVQAIARKGPGARKCLTG